MTTLFPVGYQYGLVTIERLIEIHRPHMHPAYARRVFPWIESEGGEIGIGGGFRTTQPVKPGFAPAGKSFHQAQAFKSGTLAYCALDLVHRNPGNVHRSPKWAEVPAQGSAAAKVYGVHCNVSTEAWHMQPIEIDGYDSWVNGGRRDPVADYPIPGKEKPVPAPLPPTTTTGVFTVDAKRRNIVAANPPMEGYDVFVFQSVYNGWDDFGQFKQRVLKSDGVGGIQTIAAIQEWQHGHGLTVDGQCGPQTWASVENG